MNDGGGVAAIGECMLELSAVDTDHWHMGFAGDTLNTLWAIRALLPEHPVHYVTALGDDPFSERQTTFLGEHGIGTGHSPVIAGARPGIYAITLSGVERSFTYWRADAAARQLATDPAALARSLADLKLAYFSGITLAILDESGRDTLLSALRAARGTGTLIAFDPNYRPKLWPTVESARAAMSEALAIVDIALPTFPDEQQLFGDRSPEETLNRLSRHGVAEAVVKNGTGAALVLSGGTSRSSPASPVDDAVDTTGAGDAFNGGYLAARLKNDGALQAAARAHRIAAAVVRVRGALAPFETLQEAFGG